MADEAVDGDLGEYEDSGVKPVDIHEIEEEEEEETGSIMIMIEKMIKVGKETIKSQDGEDEAAELIEAAAAGVEETNDYHITNIGDDGRTSPTTTTTTTEIVVKERIVVAERTRRMTRREK